MKWSRFGICSRSEGTFGLSRVRWTLSKTTLTTCETPLPSWQLDDGAFDVVVACAAGTAATCQPIESAATAARRISRFIPYPLHRERPTAFAASTVTPAPVSTG